MTENTVTAKQERPETSPLFRAQRWGLPQEAIDDLADRLRRVWSRFRKHFKTKTWDTGEYAFVYLRGLLTRSRSTSSRLRAQGKNKVKTKLKTMTHEI